MDTVRDTQTDTTQIRSRPKNLLEEMANPFKQTTRNLVAVAADKAQLERILVEFYRTWAVWIPLWLLALADSATSKVAGEIINSIFELRDGIKADRQLQKACWRALGSHARSKMSSDYAAEVSQRIKNPVFGIAFLFFLNANTRKNSVWMIEQLMAFGMSAEAEYFVTHMKCCVEFQEIILKAFVAETANSDPRMEAAYREQIKKAREMAAHILLTVFHA